MKRAHSYAACLWPPRTKAERMAGQQHGEQRHEHLGITLHEKHYHPQVLIFSNFSAFEIPQALLPLQPKPNHSSLSSCRVSMRCCDKLICSEHSLSLPPLSWLYNQKNRQPPEYSHVESATFKDAKQNDANVSLPKLSQHSYEFPKVS